MNKLLKDFMSSANDLINMVARVAPYSPVGKNLTTINSILKVPENQKIAIEIFITKVLIFKDKIMAGDEEFFLKKSYNEELDEYQLTSSVFEFKDIWGNLSQKHKDTIKKHMQILCLIATDYFILADKSLTASK